MASKDRGSRKGSGKRKSLGQERGLGGAAQPEAMGQGMAEGRQGDTAWLSSGEVMLGL